MEDRAETRVDDWVFHGGVPVRDQDLLPPSDLPDCLNDAGVIPQSIISAAGQGGAPCTLA